MESYLIEVETSCQVETRAIIEGVVQVPLEAMPSITPTTFVEKPFINVIVVAQEITIKVKMIVTIEGL